MNAQLIRRIQFECDLLADEIGDRGHSGRISAGKVSVGSTDYVGVIIRDLAVNPEKFGHIRSVNMLVLLPINYPAVPPMGIYLNQPYNATSSHFVIKGYHGAPSIEKEGWYWFCHSFGGFSREQISATWRPTSDPKKGHNIATIVSAARIVMNQ